ncbi:MAG TPA: LLM class flavin-dependent oxidoreductase [Solirubrobacterales bacterium]|nr:LLM class flavin-dependent oxidoreductase [Solirubrobacterales bacterium]
MRVGIYCDLRNPAPWDLPWDQHYRRALERIEGAERLGLDSVWFTEHHLFEDGYLPQPLMAAAAVAVRTTRMRIGTGVVLAPLRPPIEIAEQAAIVDILSGGRLELGLGAGYAEPEFAAFGVRSGDRFRLLERTLVEIPDLWESGRVTPPPLQSPPPIWAGVSGPRGARMAGRLGLGLLWLDPALHHEYMAGIAAGGHDQASARMGGLVNLVIADDPEAAWSQIKPNVVHQARTYMEARFAKPGDADPSLPALDPERLRSPGPNMHPPHFDVVTAAEAVARMRKWLGPLPVTDVFFWDSIAGMPEELARRHLELVATQVAPEFRPSLSDPF